MRYTHACRRRGGSGSWSTSDALREVMNAVEYISRRYTNGKGDVNELGTVFGSPVNGMKNVNERLNQESCCEWSRGTRLTWFVSCSKTHSKSEVVGRTIRRTISIEMRVTYTTHCQRTSERPSSERHACGHNLYSCQCISQPSLLNGKPNMSQ